MNVLVMSGSPRKSGRTRILAHTFESMLRERNVNTSVFDVAEDVLPLFNAEESQRQHPQVKRLMTLAEQADAFVVCTPEYHNGMSGALKNALDFLGGEFSHKPALIAAVAGGGKGGMNALNNLRTVLRGVYAFVLPEQFVLDPDAVLDEEQKLKASTQGRLTDMVDGLVDITNRLQADQTLSVGDGFV
jgi:azobenzene reductase